MLIHTNRWYSSSLTCVGLLFKFRWFPTLFLETHRPAGLTKRTSFNSHPTVWCAGNQ
uniref:Uncharacterized protein n=1 Tax=Anguilla anguilla TaxID=7936 RepID=A0A0E9UMN8_ANGAN